MPEAWTSALRCAALHSVLSSRRLGEVASGMTQARRRAFLRAARLAAPPSRTLARSLVEATSIAALRTQRPFCGLAKFRRPRGAAAPAR